MADRIAERPAFEGVIRRGIVDGTEAIKTGRFWLSEIIFGPSIGFIAGSRWPESEPFGMSAGLIGAAAGTVAVLLLAAAVFGWSFLRAPFKQRSEARESWQEIASEPRFQYEGSGFSRTGLIPAFERTESKRFSGGEIFIYRDVRMTNKSSRAMSIIPRLEVRYPGLEGHGFDPITRFDALHKLPPAEIMQLDRLRDLDSNEMLRQPINIRPESSLQLGWFAFVVHHDLMERYAHYKGVKDVQNKARPGRFSLVFHDAISDTDTRAPILNPSTKIGFTP